MRIGGGRGRGVDRGDGVAEEVVAGEPGGVGHDEAARGVAPRGSAASGRGTRGAGAASRPLATLTTTTVSVRTSAVRASQRASSGCAERPAASCRTKASLSSRGGRGTSGGAGAGRRRRGARRAAAGAGSARLRLRRVAEDEEDDRQEADRDHRHQRERGGEEEAAPLLLRLGTVRPDRLLVRLPARGLEIEVVEVVGHRALPPPRVRHEPVPPTAVVPARGCLGRLQ